MSASDELDRCGEDKQEKILQGEAGHQATQVRVLVVLGAHVQHEVPHDNLNKEYPVATGNTGQSAGGLQYSCSA